MSEKEEVEEGVKSTLSVAVRVRPLNNREKDNGQRFVWKLDDNGKSIEQSVQTKQKQRRKLAVRLRRKFKIE